MQETTKRIEWHPAFQASIQIEFENEWEKLSFEPEHLLSKKPMQIDELIIKVKDNEKVQKNIGKIFRKGERTNEKNEKNIRIAFGSVHGNRAFGRLFFR